MDPMPNLEGRLRLRQLKLVAAIGEQGTLRRAAGSINITQPTATKMLAEIEEIVGSKMYERGPRGLTANPLGRELLSFALRVLVEFERLGGALKARQNGSVGELVVGTILGTTADVVARAVVAMKEERPRLTIRLRGETSDNVLSLMEARRVDLAVGRFFETQRHAIFDYEHLGEEELCLVVRPEHPLSRKRKLSLTELADERWIMHAASNPARQVLEAEFGRAGLSQPSDVIETNSILTALQILELCDTVAMLSQSLVRDHLARGLLRRLPVAMEARIGGFGLLTRRGEPLSEPAENFAARIRVLARKLSARS
ncbi:MAG: LysR family transcriptional regulator [Rhizobiales bacterium]|nr:LysR family transcriptional regulator [Hyphomicrobiales bacterium]